MGLSVLFPLRHKMTKVPGRPHQISNNKKIGERMREYFFFHVYIGRGWSSLLCYWIDFPLFRFVKIANPEPKLHWLEDRSIFEEPCSNKKILLNPPLQCTVYNMATLSQDLVGCKGQFSQNIISYYSKTRNAGGM